MKQVLILLLFLAFSILTTAQSWRWVKGADGGVSEGDYCAVDPSGNVFGAGLSFGGYISFGTDTQTHYGFISPFVVKYDSVGNELWARTTTGGVADRLGISADVFGNLYMFGVYDSTVNISGHVLTNSNPRRWQRFITKYNSNGTLIWAKNLGNVIGSGSQGSITTDNSGNIYVATAYYYHPVLGAYSFTNTDTSNATEDFLVAKLDSSGTVLWAKSFGGSNEDYATSITVTPSNNIYICGNFYSTSLTFGGTTLLNTGTVPNHLAIFLTKLNSSGIPTWSISTGGISPYNYALGVATNTAEEVYLTGSFSIDTLTFGSYHLTTPPYVIYGYLVKYDPSGSALWAKDIRGKGMESWAVSADACDNVWIVGSMDVGTNDTIDGHVLLAPLGSHDPMFLAGWSGTGTYLQSVALSSGGDDDNSLAIDKCGNIFVEGDYEDENPFMVGTHSLIPSSGGEHKFIAKYNPNVGCTGNCDGVSYIPKYQTGRFSLYPNPANTQLIITSSEIINSVTMTNIVGQFIASYQGSTETMEINLTFLPPGVYFVKINGGDVRKFVKQ